MVTALIVWTLIGAVIGYFHASHVYQREIEEGPYDLSENPARARFDAGLYALWIFFLWVVSGILAAIAVVIWKVVQISLAG